MRTIAEWYHTLVEMINNTEYDVLLKTKISNPVVAIVPKDIGTPQRIAIYPKKTKNAGLVIEEDVFNIARVNEMLGEPRRIKGNRPHYNDIPDEIILSVCKIFLFKV